MEWEGEGESGGQTTPRRPTMLSILARKLSDRPSNNITMDASIVLESERTRMRAGGAPRGTEILETARRDSLGNCLGRLDLQLFAYS